MARDFIFAIVIVSFYEHPNVQICLVSLTHLYWIIWMIWFKPFAEFNANVNQTINDMVILIYIILLRVYTPWITDADIRYKVGFVPIAVISANFLAQATIFSISLIKSLI